MKIVVRGTNWIGDAVMTIPALRELRRVFPTAEITLHTRSWAEGVFRDADFIDDLLTYDRPASDLKEVIEQARVLRERRFDLAILFTNSFASALTARFAAIPKRFGYSRDARKFFLTNPVPVPKWKSERHEVHYYLNLVAEAAAAYSDTAPVSHDNISSHLPVSEIRRSAARRKLSEAGAGAGRAVIAIGAGSTNSRAKRWPAERFAMLNDMLQDELSAKVVMLGAPDEVDVEQNVANIAHNPPICLTGTTTLDEAVAILAEVDLFVSNDMGLAHVAAAAGTQTVVIFGPTDPRTTRPFAENAVIMRKDVECSPCMLRDCPIDHRCMEWISPREVFEIARERLGQVV